MAPNMLYRTAVKNFVSCRHVVIMLAIFTKLPAATATFCYGDFQFKRYTTEETWTKARETCERDFKGDLAKVDSVDMAKKFQEKYYIGVGNSLVSLVGGWRGDDGEFRWLDGTDLPGDLPYNEHGTGHNCLRLYHPDPSGHDANVASVKCDESDAFLCQRESPPVIKEEVEIISETQQSITCITDWCSPIWISKDGEEVPGCSEPSNRICQIISTNESRLLFNNASVLDSGVYRCKTNSESSTSQSAVVKAIGQPVIHAVETSSCSAIATLKWTASGYVINDTHIISLSDGQRFDVIAPVSNTEQSLTMTTLSPSTHYTLNITSCNLTCFTLFAPSIINFTTNGRPNKVERIHSALVDGAECSITWTLPWTSSGVLNYKIRTTESAIMYRFNSPYARSWAEEVEVPVLKFRPITNMNYTVSIRAVSCGGTGEDAVITANCSLLSAAPEIVSKPQIIPNQNAATPDMTLAIPDESGGLLSCILVIFTIVAGDSPTVAAINNTYAIDEFKYLFASNSSTKGYVAMAISPSRFVSPEPHFKFVAGDGSRSMCNLTDTSTRPQSDNITCGGDVMCGFNKQLQNLKRYSVYIAAVVPSQDSLLSVAISKYVIFETREQGISELQIVFISSGAAVLLLVIILVVLWLVRKLRSQSGPIPHDISMGDYRDSPPDPEDDYETVNTVLPNKAPPVPRRFLPSDNYEDMRVTESVGGDRDVEGMAETSPGVGIDLEETYQNISHYQSRKMQRTTLIRMKELEALYNHKFESKTDRLYQEYQGILGKLSKRKHSSQVASDLLLELRNRCRTILPYDSTRMVAPAMVIGYLNTCNVYVQCTFLRRFILGELIYQNTIYSVFEFQKIIKVMWSLAALGGPQILEGMRYQFAHFDWFNQIRGDVVEIVDPECTGMNSNYAGRI